MMIIIIGKTASGKDAIVNKLVSEHGYKKIITYTTRPMRKGEKQGVTYHFISENEFKEKVNNELFIEWKKYNTEFGIWYYGTSLEDINNATDNTIVILTPDGYRDAVKNVNRKFISIYIYANNETIERRLLKRGDDKDEAQRRLKHDNIDFNGIQNEVDTIIYNNSDTELNDVIYKILKFIKRKQGEEY